MGPQEERPSTFCSFKSLTARAKALYRVGSRLPGVCRTWINHVYHTCGTSLLWTVRMIYIGLVIAWLQFLTLLSCSKSGRRWNHEVARLCVTVKIASLLLVRFDRTQPFRCAPRVAQEELGETCVVLSVPASGRSSWVAWSEMAFSRENWRALSDIGKRQPWLRWYAGRL